MTGQAVGGKGIPRTPMILSSLHPFVNSPFLFSSVVLKSNAASYNGSSLAYTVKNVGNRSASAQIYIGNGWSAGIPPLAPGATYSGNSTGWLQGPPVQGSMVTLVVQGYFQNTFSLSVIDTQLTS